MTQYTTLHYGDSWITQHALQRNALHWSLIRYNTLLQVTVTHLDLRATGMPERFINALDYNEFTDVIALNTDTDKLYTFLG